MHCTGSTSSYPINDGTVREISHYVPSRQIYYDKEALQMLKQFNFKPVNTGEVGEAVIGQYKDYMGLSEFINSRIPKCYQKQSWVPDWLWRLVREVRVDHYAQDQEQAVKSLARENEGLKIELNRVKSLYDDLRKGMGIKNLHKTPRKLRGVPHKTIRSR